ncbi:MAG: hypothetical protein R3C61_21705 [Bacteroidia bacterium]
MKSLFMITALLFIGFISLSQNITSADEAPVLLGVPAAGNTENVVGFYVQLEKQTAELNAAKTTYEAALANSQTEEEKEMNAAILASIDQMIRTNERIMEGNVTIQRIESSDNQ